MSHNKTDLFTIIVRFVFGFVIGCVFGFFSVSFYAPETTQSVQTLTLGSGVVVGLLAVVFGDEFWRSFGKWW